jgi:hypothetical protein
VERLVFKTSEAFNCAWWVRLLPLPPLLLHKILIYIEKLNIC